MNPILPTRMAKVYQSYVDDRRVYSCTTCHAHLARHQDIISKAFQGRHGRAYLFNNVENISIGAREDRHLITGLHSVADIACKFCQTTVGWKYVYAFEDAQKYKEGKYIIEKARISKENNWNDEFD